MSDATRFTSSDGLLSSSDPAAVALWDSIGARMDADERTWTELLRGAGVKLAHPDDGWVKRDRGIFDLSWYPAFNDRPEVGDLIAFGKPPSGEHYRSWADVFPRRAREKDPYRRERARHYSESPEVAAEGYRICRVTSVTRRGGPLSSFQSFEYEDTELRMPPRAPVKRWWHR